jgi:membrane associated rhomboid family serine protease/Flp pilus assembly protein TadD
MANCIRCGRKLSGLRLGKKICGWCKQHEAAQRGEDSGYQPVMATPWKRREAMPMLVTQALFGINVAVFIGMVLSGASPMSPSGASLLAWGANIGPYTLTGQWWRLVSSCFVHIGIIHLALNMWCLWSLGELAEQLYGHVTFACVYLLCGIAGSLASVYWHAAPTMSAGASGAIFGIAGAVIASIKLGEFAYPMMARGILQSLIVFVGYNVVFGAISGITDNACHIGGLAAGLVLGALMAKAAPEERLLPRLGVMLVVAAVLMGSGYKLQRSRAYRYYLMRASAELEEGRTDAAISMYAAAAKLRPESAPAIHRELAELYRGRKDYASAERELLASGVKDEASLYLLGIMRLEDHKLDEARQTFGQMLAQDARSAAGHMGLGAVASAQGDEALALKEYAQALEVNPGLAYAHAKMGESLMRLKRYDEAIAAFNKEIETSGEDADTEQALAAAYEEKGMKTEAEAARTKAEKLKRDE